MRITPQELSEGYCQISCGRCDCCERTEMALVPSTTARQFADLATLTSRAARPDMRAGESVATLLANRGFKHFLALLNLTSDEVAQALPRPGFMAAVVAAHDDAVLAGLAKLGALPWAPLRAGGARGNQTQAPSAHAGIPRCAHCAPRGESRLLERGGGGGRRA